MTSPFKEPRVSGLILQPQLIHMGSDPYLIEVMRQIRNECKEYVARLPVDVTMAQQALWWQNFDHRRARLYLYLHPGASYVGFGNVRLDAHDNVWITGGLRESARGMGLGADLFRHLTAHADRVYLDVLETNERAYRLYISLGYKPLYIHDGIITMGWEKGAEVDG